MMNWIRRKLLAWEICRVYKIVQKKERERTKTGRDRHLQRLHQRSERIQETDLVVNIKPKQGAMVTFLQTAHGLDHYRCGRCGGIFCVSHNSMELLCDRCGFSWEERK